MTRTPIVRPSTTISNSTSSMILRRSRALGAAALSWWSIHHSRPKPYPSSSPTPKSIQARSTWRRSGRGVHHSFSECCSKRWQVRYWYLKDLGDLLQPAGPDAVGAFLVFLHLLEGEAEGIPQLFLAHCKHHAAHAHAAADMLVNGVRGLFSGGHNDLLCSRGAR